METKTCPHCGAEMHSINGGISKSGKPYNPFYSCPECKHTENTGAKFIPSKEPDFMERKEKSIARAQERKEESIRMQGAKRDAGLIVAAMINAKELKGSDWKDEYQKIAEWIVNYYPDEIIIENEPF